MKRSILSIFLLVFLLSPITNFANEITFTPRGSDGSGNTIFVSSGNWNESSNWTPIGLPSPGNTINIPAEKTVNFDIQIDWRNTASATTIIVNGELHFEQGMDILLNDISNVVVYDDGKMTAKEVPGNGNGQAHGVTTYILIGADIAWSSKVNNTLEGPWDLKNETPVITLPIELTSFKAYAKGTAVEILWSTASESNNDFFSVERSLNGIDFEVIAEVIAAGNSNTSLSYSYTDEEPLEDLAYYRLKQTDFNLDYSYSKLVVVKNEVSKKQIFKVYPNPVNKSESINLFISGENLGDIKISVYNAYGRMVFSQTLNNIANTEVPLDFHNAIPKGTYFITFVSNNTVYKQKLIVND